MADDRAAPPPDEKDDKQHSEKKAGGPDGEPVEQMLGGESPEIVEAAVELGARRLQRVTGAHVMTALIGGMAVSFGVLAMAVTAGPWLAEMGQERAHWLGSLVFPLGFIILLVGKGELFTENFLMPVTGVIEKRARPVALLELWGATLAFNLVGGAIFAFVGSRREVLSADAVSFVQALAEELVSASFVSSLTKAVFAGWLMTLLTWLLLAARGLGARLFLIWILGFLIVAGHFNHVVISSEEVMLAFGLGMPNVLGTWMRANFWAGVIGNMLGGLIFVTLAGYVHAHTMGRETGARRSQRERPPDSAGAIEPAGG